MYNNNNYKKKSTKYRESKQTDEKEKYGSAYTRINNNSDVSHIYYNILVANNNTAYDDTGNQTTTLLATQLLFNQTRDKPYLNTPEDYDLIVPGFTVDSNSYPSQIVQPVVGSSIGVDGFPTVYTYFFYNASSNTYGGPYNLIWTPADTTLIPPASPITSKDITNEYFFNYSIDYFLGLLNKQIKTNLDSFIPGPQNPSQRVGYPYFYYDTASGLISINAGLQRWRTDENGVNVTTTTSYPSIFKILLSPMLYNLVAGTPYIYNYNNTRGGTYTVCFVAKPDASNIFTQYSNMLTVPPTGIPTINYLRINQDYPSYPSLWSPAASLVFRAVNLSVVNTIEGQPYIYGVNPNPETNNALVLNNFFELFLGRYNPPIINYYPTSEYRSTNLLGIVEQSDLQITAYWKDFIGVLHPFFLEAGSTFDMKILFRKKIFNL